MAVYDLPSGLIISNVTLKHYTPQFITTSLNLKRRGRDRDIHQLQGTFDVTIASDRDLRRFESWLCKMGGRLNQFNLRLGGRFAIPTSRLTEPTISTPVGIGATSITLYAFNGEIWEGDMLNLPNDTKTYIATNDLSGGGVLNVKPSIRQQQIANTQVTMNNPTVTAMLDEDIHPIEYSEAGIITSYTCAWKEYL